MFEITQGNLFGKGQLIKLRAELGSVTQYYDITFKEPWFLDKPISLTANIYKTTTSQFIEYDKKATGVGLSLGKRFSDYWSGDITYRFENANIYNVTTTDKLVRDQEGVRVTSSITPSISRDSRDNYLDPSKGSRNSLYVTYAGLGGTNHFIKSEIDSAWFFPLGSTTAMLRGRVGYASGILGKELPLYERFYVGGIYTVRGLGFGEAGPRDSHTNDPIGGNEELVFNAEYIFPIVTDVKLKGVAFFDAGNSYDSFKNLGILRYTTGAGVRWISPVGPVRVEWGYNLQKKPGEQSSRVEFAFGTFF